MSKKISLSQIMSEFYSVNPGCPRSKYHGIPSEPSEACKHGTEVHKALEERLSKNTTTH